MVAAGAASASAAHSHGGGGSKSVVTNIDQLPILESLKIGPGTCTCKVESAIGVAWAERIIMVTATSIYFSKPDSTSAVDHIPCHEVEGIHDPDELIPDQSHHYTMAKRGTRASMRSTMSEPDDDPEDAGKGLSISTLSGGHNSGRTTHLMFETIDERDEWQQKLEQVVSDAKTRVHKALNPTRLARCQRKCNDIYSSNLVQYAVGMVIFASYVTSIIGSQILPKPGSAVAGNLKLMEYIFTAIFTAELFFNAFGSWFWPFVSDTWNIFDSIVVVISIVGLIQEGLPAVNVLRLVRVFKMVRLFRKLTSLRILTNALSSSIVPVTYAFLILVLVTSIYAVIATDLFYMVDPAFSSFSASLFTLFQVATGDSWASAVSRGLMSNELEPQYTDWIIGIFFSSYVLIVGIVLMNIVVAVLLDEFISTGVCVCVCLGKQCTDIHYSCGTSLQTDSMPGGAVKHMSTVASEKAADKAIAMEAAKVTSHHPRPET